MSAPRVLFDAPGPKARRRHRLGSVIGLVVLIIAPLIWLGWELWTRGQITADRWEPFTRSNIWVNYLLPGLWTTIKAAAISITIAFVLGLVLSMGRMSDLRPLRWVTAAFVEFFRAVPVLIMMIFVYFLLSYQDLGPRAERPLIAVVVGLVCYNAAVIGEVVRNGVSSLPAGQREAGLSVGLSPSQTRRLILVPQALTAMMPTLVSQLVVVLKDTALGYIILYPEFLYGIRRGGAAEQNMLATFMVGAAIYIFINWLITQLAEMLEGRLRKTGHTAGAVAAAGAPAEPGAADDTPTMVGPGRP